MAEPVWLALGLATLASLAIPIGAALALGALVGGDLSTAVLLAVLIFLQNLPGGFNAMRELVAVTQRRPAVLMLLFVAIVPLGPLVAALGLMLPPGAGGLVGAVMVFTSGGILFLMFQDIAPQGPLSNAALPPFRAILGFAVGLAGSLLV